MRSEGRGARPHILIVEALQRVWAIVVHDLALAQIQINQSLLKQRRWTGWSHLSCWEHHWQLQKVVAKVALTLLIGANIFSRQWERHWFVVAGGYFNWHVIPLCKSIRQKVRLGRLLSFVDLCPHFYMHEVFAWLRGCLNWMFWQAGFRAKAMQVYCRFGYFLYFEPM